MITAKQAAKLMNVSVRNHYKAREVYRLRPDLEKEIMDGRMSLHKAWLIATNRTKPSKLDKLVAAWNGADDDARKAFLDMLFRTPTEQTA